MKILISHWVGACFFLLSVSHLAFSQSPVPPPFAEESWYSHWADSVMETLSPSERVAQLFMVAAYSNRGPGHSYELSRLIEQEGIGGLIFFQGGPERQALLHNHYQHLSKIPLLVAMDAEWGIGMRLDSTISFPYQMALGAIQDDELIYEMGAEIARQFRLMGMHVNFAPVVDVNNNPKNPVISYRSFGENKSLVSRKGLQYMKGLQEHGVLATAKHFPGHGDTGTDSHVDLPVIPHDPERLSSLELFPFRQLINQGLGSTMIAHLSIPAWDATPQLPSTLSQPIVTGVLQKQLGFKGLIFTDAMNMKGLTKHFPTGEAEIRALLAGNDVLLYSEDVPTAIRAINEALKSGRITQEIIDRKCHRILQTKAWALQFAPVYVDRGRLCEQLNTPAALHLNEKLTAASLTLLRNTSNRLPLHRLDTLHIAALSIHSQPTLFQHSLSQYTKITPLLLSRNATAVEVRQMQKRLEEFNLVLVGLHQPGSRPYNREYLNESVRQLVVDLAKQTSSVISVFRNPYALDRFPGIEQAEGLIMAYQGGEAAERLAAQLIFGAIGASGRLPVTVNENFPQGAGMDSPGGLRMAYTSPEAVGIVGGPLRKKLDAIVRDGLDQQAYPGAQLLVAKDGKVIVHKAYGYHSYDSLRKVGTDDLYDFASVTKITAGTAAVMKLYDNNKLKLDANLAQYLPEFKSSNKGQLTFREMLAHQARLRPWIPYWTGTLKGNAKYPWQSAWNPQRTNDYRFRSRTFSRDSSANYPIRINQHLWQHKDFRKQMYKAIRKSPLNDDPGYIYSGLLFYLLPEITARHGGMEFESFLKQNFYHRLGAHTLTFNPAHHHALKDIIPTERDTFFRNDQIHGWVHDEGAAMMGGVSGNAGLFGNANDLAKLMHMYMNGGSYGGEQYLAPETLQEFTRYQFRKEGNRRGLGFDKPRLSEKSRGFPAPAASESSFGHSGYTGAFTWADPEHKLLLVFLSNRVNPTRLNRKVYQLDIYQRLHRALYEELVQGK